MTNEETTEGVVLETQNNEEVTEVEETTDVEETTTETQSDDLAAELAKAKAEAAKFRRLLSKKDKEKSEAPKKTDTAPSQLTKDEGKLYAKVYSSDLPDELADDAVERVRKIATLDGISYDEAYRSEDFQVWKERRVREAKQERAQLRTTRGGKAEIKKTFGTEGLSDEDHKALWRERNS